MIAAEQTLGDRVAHPSHPENGKAHGQAPLLIVDSAYPEKPLEETLRPERGVRSRRPDDAARAPGDGDSEAVCALTYPGMCGLDTSLERDRNDDRRSGAADGAKRVLVVFERGAGGMAALREAAELAEAGAEVSVVTLAPQAKPLRCCGGGGAGPYNHAV
ncbi:MAG TPA: hypothetical protein VKA05_01600, partial [Acidimicrobiales bacterium]|nr:hypothetical protein [Acidimicrobiales bacterium]